MKTLAILFLAFLLSYKTASQDSTSVIYGASFTFKATISKSVVYTCAYYNSSILLKQTELCNFCYIENGRSYWINSITETISQLFPAVVNRIKDKNITIYVLLKPNLKGEIVDASLGWCFNKRLDLFTESELLLIRKNLLKLSARINSIDKYGNTQLCQTLTISIFPKDWNKQLKTTSDTNLHSLSLLNFENTNTPHASTP